MNPAPESLMQDHNAPPLNPLPPVVWALALPMIAMEVVLSAGESGLVGGPLAVGWRLEAVTQLAVIPDLMREMVALRDFPLQHVARLVAYPFVHGNLTHAVFAIVILLALGKFTGEVLRWWAMLAICFAASVVGAVAYCAVPGLQVPLLGAYPPVYGLIGAFTYILWLRLAGSGVQYRAFSMIGMLLAVQFLFALLFGGGWDWVADLAGFATGFLMSFVLVPGGGDRLRHLLRDR